VSPRPPEPSSEGAAFDRLRGVFDELPAAVALVSGPDHVFEFVNPAYRRLVGDREFEGLNVDEAMPELREQGFVDLLDEVYRTGERFVGRETKVTLVHGDETEEIVVDFIYQPIRGASGEVEAILGFAVDVTAAVRAREQLTEALRREQEDRFRAAIDSMNDTVIIARPLPDGDGRVDDFLVTFVNSGPDEVGRRRREDLIGRRFTELWPNVTATGLLERYLDALETGQPVELEAYDYRDRVGGAEVSGVFDIRATKFDGELLVVFRDVTDRVARERALAESRAREAREHQSVVALQAALLPRELPPIDGVDIAAEYIAATEGLEVGGDWFDVFPLPDDTIAICVGDVAGKGIDAAQIMAQLRSAGRVAALAGQDPAEVMASKNTLMISGGLGPFATTVFMRYEPATGEATWTSAGHLPPLIVPADGSPPRLLPTPEQPALGVVPNVTYTCESVTLETGDRLVLYTDGLVERRGEAITEGLSRLREAVPPGADAADTCRILLEVFDVESERPDDVCLLTLRRTN
jgi:PAS domain S-box-containing protein